MPVILSSKSKQRSQRIADDESLITKSLKRFKITSEAESKDRSKSFEDLKFSIGTGLWDESVKANREIEGKPCLTVNRAPAFLRQYTGEERQHRPAMLVSPVGSGADIEVAKIHQGVLRHIEVVSSADVAYDMAYEMMMRIGWCPWRIRTDYIHERSFFQEPRIEPMENPFAYYGSPVRRPDGTDPLWAHVINNYSHDDYIAEFGETDLVKLHFPSEMGNAEPGWVTKDGARVAEYWWMDLTPSTLVQLDDGAVKLKDELTAGEKRRIVGERDTTIRKVNCVKHDAIRVLKKYEYLGQYIPFPEVNGVRLNVNGEIYRAGMVRDYRDAQRIYDFMVTRGVEQVDQCSKDPLMVPRTPGNVKDGEIYRQLNRKNYSHIFYDPYTSDGKQVPVPQRAGREAPVQAIREMIQQADYDMKAVIGIYGPGLGEEAGSEQESGFAIMTRQQQSDTGMLTWHDNLNRAIVWQGKILLDLWPKLINAARVQRIINPDDSVKHAVVFNGQYGGQEDAEAMLNEEMGLKKAYDVGAGDYDLTLSSGPMYRTARAETFKALGALIQADPQFCLPVLGDIWLKNGDFPDAEIAAERLKKMLPPNLQDSDGDDDKTKLAQAQAQLAALSQQHNQLVAELNRAADTIRTKRLEIESKERIKLHEFQHDLVMQELKAHDAGALEHLKASLAAIQGRLDKLHDTMSVEDEAGEAPDTPELPGKVEPHVQPITPAAPAPKPEMIP